MTWDLRTRLKKANECFEFWMFHDTKQTVRGKNKAPNLRFNLGNLNKNEIEARTPKSKYRRLSGESELTLLRLFGRRLFPLLP